MAILFFFHYLKVGIQTSNFIEFAFLLVYFFSLFLMLYCSIKASQKENKFLIFIPLVFLFSAFGPVVMFNATGYMKGISILYALIPLSLVYIKNSFIFKRVVKIFLLLITLSGLYFFYQARFAGPPFNIEAALPSFQFLEEDTGARPLKNFDAEIKLLNASDKNSFSNMPFEKFFLKEYRLYEFEITNSSDEIWENRISEKLGGRYHVALGYNIFKMPFHKLVREGRAPLPKRIYPGESFKVKMLLPILDGNDYLIRISLVQEGYSWFYTQGENYLDLKEEKRIFKLR